MASSLDGTCHCYFSVAAWTSPVVHLHWSSHFFCNWSFSRFWSSFHRDRGTEWRGILYPPQPVLLQPPTTHLPCILRRFWHTIACSHVLFLAFLKWRHKQNSTHSPLFLGRERGKRVIIQTLKIHTKLAKIATMIIFSQWWPREKGNLY